ncbi:MAG: ATP-binding cassette domain-containing protein [Bacteroidota bacterium]|nr:ATP-binding cassette domain-containing protein [Bacteroidota bacterium]
MSEEILKALMQLFAIIAKQDEGVESHEREFVISFLDRQLDVEAVKEYIALFDKFAGSNKTSAENVSAAKVKLTSVKDSVKILGLCKKINKTLNQEQKVVVLARLFELVNADRKFSDQRMAIIHTVAEVFNVSKEEFNNIENFVIKDEPVEFDSNNILVINDKDESYLPTKHLQTEKLDGSICILRVPSVELYFLKYTGNEDLFLNGLGLAQRSINLFASGSAIKLPKGKPVYYSDVVAHFLADTTSAHVSFEVNHIDYAFPNGNLGIRDVSFSEKQGRLIGIMGASGAGKTTLLNVLAGNEPPSKGEVLINGINLATQKEQLDGVIGLIPQDDLLIEELTVFENLYYNAKLCFRDKSEGEIEGLVNKTLASLGLLDYANLKVGSALNKTISGGQRKRLNIALELIREPSILFVDEPTSGLSSRDSENVMDLLRELALKGKLIFVVIHQPSSEIYKMFDRIIILDTGGYMIYYGNPVEAVMYFKKIDAQINSEVGECPTCGNVNPELIFNIIEAKVVDEFGRYTNQRKVSPQKWEEYYRNNLKSEKVEQVKEAPPKTLNIPNWFRQFKIYSIRDFLSKISNKQYIALNLLEAPILGLILAYVIRYIADPTSNVYIFRENENIPIYIFMALIVALFLGLTISAEEIFRDRKILKREEFLNLSRSAYLAAKILILFAISAIQCITFVLIANTILGIKGMTFAYWFALFSTAAFANMLGLNVSASFNSAVTIYILIPLLMIPMMMLSGAMFSFDKLNRNISSVGKVPVIADLMVTKWSYEALMVHQYKDNEFEKTFYDVEKLESAADFKQVHYVPELSKRFDQVSSELQSSNKINKSANALLLLKNEIANQKKMVPVPAPDPEKLNPQSFNTQIAQSVKVYLDNLASFYSKEFQKANSEKNNMINYLMQTKPEVYKQMKNDYQNESVSDAVRKVYEKNKIIEYNHQLVQQVDPVYEDPSVCGLLDIRAHFYAPRKHFLGHFFDTYSFNMAIIWIFTLIFYITLYYENFKKILNFSYPFKSKSKSKSQKSINS